MTSRPLDPPLERKVLKNQKKFIGCSSLFKIGLTLFMLQSSLIIMETDTGAAVTVITETTYRKTWGREKVPLIQPCTTRLHRLLVKKE